MMRLFFDLHECGHGAVTDHEGAEVIDLAAARELAITAARGIMAEEVGFGRLCLGCAIAIRDESGVTVLAVPFSEALLVTFAEAC